MVYGMQNSENKPIGFCFMLISEQDMDLAKSRTKLTIVFTYIWFCLKITICLFSTDIVPLQLQEIHFKFKKDNGGKV
jgi:hypothetical protein